MTCGTGPLSISYNQLLREVSSIAFLDYSQLTNNSSSWNMFRTVELYNSNISTQHANGNVSSRYYVFQSYNDQIEYITGQSLYYTYLGYSTVVQKN